jgi:GT2 family glycosyltransferase/glycosyltransferase involved in cell wall biosynthesis/SAM-dependent methyltransferase/Flp pilus assembly protein TadD
MRVALVFDDTVRPDTTGVHCRDGLEELCEVQHFRPGHLPSISSHGFDLYLHIDDGLRYRLPTQPRPSAWWVIDTHLNYDWDLEKASDFDYVFAAQRDGAEQLRADGIEHVEWLPLACNPRFHRHHDLPKLHDVCFIGALAPGERQRLLKLLQGEFERVHVGHAYWEEMARVYSQSRIVFNRSIANDVNMRVFEAVACGSLLVTNDLADNGLEDLLRNGEHLVTYRDDAELLERVRYYLAHEGEREAIARRGMEEAHAGHTYRHRMQRILEVAAGAEQRQRQPSSEAPPHYYRFARPELVALVPREAQTILDVGCGAGRMGEALKRRQRCRAVGIEKCADAAAEARGRLDEAIVADVEGDGLDLSDRTFDCVVCGDVLEHLREPGRVLSRLAQHLTPDGTVVASLPNVRNCEVLRDLAAGFWSYEPAGIMDQTHLRFFTLGEALRLFAESGLQVERVDRVFDPQVEQWRASGRATGIQLGQAGLTLTSAEDAEELFVVQYLLVGRPKRERQPRLASIIILAWNQIGYTKLCVESVLQRASRPYELILVDNGSTDGTAEYFATVPGAKVIRNPDNLGFPKGVNQGLQAAAGEYLVLLNNDTIVTEGWLDRLVACAESAEDVAMVGPRTNYVSGDQLVQVPYVKPSQIEAFAAEWAWRHRGEAVETSRLIGFCLLMKRPALQQVGLLDESFGLGTFEDDDLCLRMRQAGYRLLIAGDCFIHHFGSRTLIGQGIDAEGLLAGNWRRFSEKWAPEPEGAEAAEPPRAPSQGRRAERRPAASPPAPGARRPDHSLRVAVVSLLFNWPSMGGGNMDTVGLVRALGQAGHEVRHLYAHLPAMRVGDVSSDLSTPSRPVALGPGLPTCAQVGEAFRRAVGEFRPDTVVITDSWTSKPFLARALSGYRYVLRFQALEGLCPLNAARFTVRDGRITLCDSHLLADAPRCRGCLRTYEAQSGALQAAERALSGADASEAYAEATRRALEGAAAALVYNPLLAAAVAPYTPIVRVATPGVDLAQLRRVAPVGDPPCKVVLLPSLWTEGLKGYHVLAEACAQLRRQRSDFEVRVAGPQPGPIDEWTTCVGWYPQDRLAELYGQADIVVVPSVWEEPFGIVAAEGAAAGRPVVASRVGGLQTIVEDGVTGFLFRAGDTAELADRLGRLLDDPSLRHAFGAAGQARAQKLYAWDYVVRQYYEPVLYDRTLAPGSAAGAPQRRPETASHRKAGLSTTPDRKAGRKRARSGRRRRQGRPTISLCLIARDEEQNIEACLNSIRPWVDEMIVVDTGSKDRTPDIARACGARVKHFEWCDDFSAARNASLKYATGDWIFWMDADDVIDEANGRRLRELAAGAPPDVFGLTVRVHCLPRPGEEAGIEAVDHVKLLRNHPDVRFEFHIHEQVLPSIRRLGKEVAISDVFVTHAGYDVTLEGQRRKRERDLRLLGLDLAEHPNHPFVHFNVGMTAFHSDDLQTATDHLERSIALAGPSESHLRKAYALLTACHRRQEAWQAAREACERGLAACPGDPELLFNRGMICHRLGDFATAEESYRCILESPAAEPYLRSVDAGIAGFKTRHNLAMLYRDMGRPPAAEDQLRRAVAEEPAFVPSWFALVELLRSTGRRDELDGLAAETCGAERSRGVGELVRARMLFEEGRDPEVLATVTRALALGLGPNVAHGHRLHAHALLRLGRVAEAVEVLRELVDSAPASEEDHGNLVLALTELGRHAEARKAARAALELHPGSRRLRQLLAGSEGRAASD